MVCFQCPLAAAPGEFLYLMNVSDEMLFPFSALQSPDTEHHADEAVNGDGNPDTGYAHLQRTGGQVDQSDPQPPTCR